MARVGKIGKAFFIRNGVWYPLSAASSRVWRWNPTAIKTSKVRGPKAMRTTKATNSKDDNSKE